MKPAIFGVLFFVLLSLSLDLDAKTKRSPTARAQFMKANPCPSTGKTSGICEGWEVDHIVPLQRGGADTKKNMQWLSVEEHREKTRAENLKP